VGTSKTTVFQNSYLSFISGQVKCLLPDNHKNRYKLFHGSIGQRLNWQVDKTGHLYVCGGPC